MNKDISMNTKTSNSDTPEEEEEEVLNKKGF